jgi:hypothetical protein
MRRTISLVLLLAAAPASAQLVPRADPHELARDASPRAHLVSAPDGRISRAWSLGIRLEASSFLARYRDDLAIARDGTYRLDRTLTAHGITSQRFVRVAHGGDVIGSSIVIGTRAGRVEYVFVSRADALPITSSAAIDRDRAIRVAGDRALEVVPGALEIGGVLVPVYRVDTAGQHLHERDRVIVDARDGRVLARLPRAIDALGRVFEANPITNEGTTAEVTLPSLTSRELLTGRYFRAANCNASDRGCEVAQLAVADATTGDFLYDPIEPSFTDAFAEVHAYYHANLIARYFRDTHGFTWTCGGDPLMRLFVNYTEAPNRPFGNAMYAPSASTECGYMLFGQGEDHDFAYDASVVYHENAHSIVDEVAGLDGFLESSTGVSFEPGALNEGFADYFAATITESSVIGAYFRGEDGATDTGLRDVANAFTCPNDLVGEVHYDGRIWGALGWDLRDALGAAKADALVFATLAAIPEAPSLAEAADAMIAAAEALATDGTWTADDLTAVRDAVAMRGLAGCERVVPLDGPRTGYSGYPGITSMGGGLAPIQYRVDVPADALSLTIAIESIGRTTGRYRLYARAGAPVEFGPTGVVADLEPEPDTAIARGDLPRCDTLYVAVAQTDLESAGPTLYSIGAALETSGAVEECPEPDAGVTPIDAGASDAGVTDAGADAGTEPMEGGCGCRAAPSRSPAPVALLIAALGWSSVRRRRP